MIYLAVRKGSSVVERHRPVRGFPCRRGEYSKASRGSNPAPSAFATSRHEEQSVHSGIGADTKEKTDVDVSIEATAHRTGRDDVSARSSRLLRSILEYRCHETHSTGVERKVVKSGIAAQKPEGSYPRHGYNPKNTTRGRGSTIVVEWFYYCRRYSGV